MVHMVAFIIYKLMHRIKASKDEQLLIGYLSRDAIFCRAEDGILSALYPWTVIVDQFLGHRRG